MEVVERLCSVSEAHQGPYLSAQYPNNNGGDSLSGSKSEGKGKSETERDQGGGERRQVKRK